MKLRANAAIGAVDIAASITHGALDGEAEVDQASVDVREGEHFHCEFDRSQHIKDEWVLFSVPCMDGWNLKMCDVKAGPIDATIHWTIDITYFKTAANIKHTVVRLDGERGVKACGGELSDLRGPTVAGAYVPSFNNSIPFISDVINGIILTVGYSFESSLINAVGTAASLANLFHRPELLGSC
ncbi:MAG TPA: hypothetical protein VH988_05895 [Thermoanaerobaculia bacterium]|jgi:hypothetical protein|nr:hypothetical protein [Thermoanaerobaculia bacterium]